MASITIDIQGISKAIEDFKKLDTKVAKGVKNAVNESALKIQSDAKKLAPVNLGTLRNNIYLKEFANQEGFAFSVGVNVPYAPYIEFGTGGKVSIPNGYQEYANQFKGKTGGTFAQMLKALMQWVEQKGITGTYSVKTQRRTGNKATQASQNKSAAYAIAISILRKGLRPHPFLIPAFEQEKSKLITKIENVIKNA